MMRKLSKRKLNADPVIKKLAEGDAWHHDIMGYLGFMNTSLAALSLLRLYVLFKPSASRALTTGTVAGDIPLDVLSLVILGIANCSQAYGNFMGALGSDRWIMGKGLDRITVLDAVFTVLDWMAALGKIAQL